MVPENYRVKFTKTGSMQFISHLDLCRTMRSALIRAKLPVWYTEGFNPHPKMVFALPLSIGTQSVTEYMDIKMNSEISESDFLSRLDAQFTDEMKILEVYRPQTKFNIIKWAEYDIDFAGNIESAKNIFNSPYVVMKKSKSGEKETDIVPYIGKISFSENRINVILSAENDSYLNPEYIASAVSKAANIEDYDIMRRRIYLDGMTKEFR